MSERYCTSIKEHAESHNEGPFDVCQSTRIEALEFALAEADEQVGITRLERDLFAKQTSVLRIKLDCRSAQLEVINEMYEKAAVERDALKDIINSDKTTLDACRVTIDALRAENEKHQEIFSWLLGENGEFPESTPGKRYGFRTELRKRLAQSLLSGSNKSCEGGK